MISVPSWSQSLKHLGAFGLWARQWGVLLLLQAAGYFGQFDRTIFGMAVPQIQGLGPGFRAISAVAEAISGCRMLR